MQQQKTYHQIFDEIKRTRANEDRKKVFYKYSSQNLKMLLVYAFHPNIKFLLPEGLPPYDPSANTESLDRWIDKFHYLADPNVAKDKREKIFINMISNLPKEEVELIEAIKDGLFTKKYHISKKLVMETFPKLSKDWGE